MRRTKPAARRSGPEVPRSVAPAHCDDRSRCRATRRGVAWTRPGGRLGSRRAWRLVSPSGARSFAVLGVAGRQRPNRPHPNDSSPVSMSACAMRTSAKSSSTTSNGTTGKGRSQWWFSGLGGPATPRYGCGSCRSRPRARSASRSNGGSSGSNPSLCRSMGRPSGRERGRIAASRSATPRRMGDVVPLRTTTCGNVSTCSNRSSGLREMPQSATGDHRCDRRGQNHERASDAMEQRKERGRLVAHPGRHMVECQQVKGADRVAFAGTDQRQHPARLQRVQDRPMRAAHPFPDEPGKVVDADDHVRVDLALRTYTPCSSTPTTPRSTSPFLVE